MPAIIPQPLEHELLDENPFVLQAGARVLAPADVTGVAEHLAAHLRAAGHQVSVDPTAHEARAGDIVLRLSAQASPSDVSASPAPSGFVGRRPQSPAAPDDESYELTVRAGTVELTASSSAGLFRAATTFTQLLGPGRSTGSVPAVHVVDAPRYTWRGLMVDVVRHWFGPEVLRRVIDLAAAYKLNVLHLHLTDDQAWRLTLPSRPRLTEVAGTSQVGGGEAGFLTAADYVDLVAYAAERYVTVVPEIDTPGHTNAATHAYGELTPGGEPTEAYTGTAVGFSALHLAQPATLRFLRDVFTDLAALTPGPHLHVGGDEVETMAGAEYTEFVTTVGEVVAATDKAPVVWQEGAVAALPPGALVQLWDPRMSTEGVRAAAARGHQLVLSPSDRVYLDMKYGPDFPLGADWSGHVDVSDTYEWDPGALVEGLDPAAVRGVEAAVWTETISTEDELFTMLLPRLVAVAEVAWSAQERRALSDFTERLAAHGPRWEAAGWAYHRSSQVGWL